MSNWYDEMKKAIDSLPQMEIVPKEEKRGRWIAYPREEWGAANCECSVCHRRQFFPLLLKDGGDNYCPNCGAKMQGEADE